MSIVVPCRNEVRGGEACFKSVLTQEPPAGGMEIIVADGMSEDGTRELVERMAVANDRAVIIIDNPGKIVSSGLNSAIRAAKGDIIIRMDAHTEFAQDYVRTCVELLDATGADNVGGPARTKPNTYLERAIAAAYHSPFSVGGARFHNVQYEGPVDTVTYGCWRKQAFERFGYFDEELVRNQDDEHNLRITRGGGKIWQSPRIRSWYRPRGSLQALFRQYLQYGYWKVRVIQKHKLPASVRHLVPGGFLLLLLLTGICSTFWRPARVSFLDMAALYGVGVIAASLAAARTDWKVLPMLPLVFPCYHVGYGYGFLWGIWDFVIRKRIPRTSLQQLTR